MKPYETLRNLMKPYETKLKVHFMSNETQRKVTTHATFFAAVNLMKESPDEYSGVPIIHLATKVSDELGSYISPEKVKEAATMAGVIECKKGKSRDRARALGAGIVRTFERLGISRDKIDSEVLRIANLKNVNQNVNQDMDYE